MLIRTKPCLLLDVFVWIKIKYVFELINMNGLSNKIIIMKFLFDLYTVDLSSSDSIKFQRFQGFLWAFRSCVLSMKPKD